MLLVEVSPYVWDDFARQGDRSKTGAFARDPKEAALRHGVGGRLVVIRAVADTKDITARGSRFSVAIAECAAPVISGPLVDLEELDPTERTDSESDEFSNFLGDIEALIPADCRNSIANRLHSVRSAVGMMGQQWVDAMVRVSKAEADARMWNERFLAEQKLAMDLAGSGPKLDPAGREELSTAQPGTGAWAWEQMQRWPEVWVWCKSWLDGARWNYRDGHIYNNRGFRIGGHKILLDSTNTDWELCAAPGSVDHRVTLAEEASKRWVSETAPSAKDGPTPLGLGERIKLGQLSNFFTASGKQEAEAGQFAPLLAHVEAIRSAAWQAAREGMVTQERLAEVKREVIQWTERYEVAESRTRELANAKLQLEMSSRIDTEQIAQLKGQLTTAERRVGELEKQWLAACEELDAVYETDSGNFPGTTKDVVGAIVRLKADVVRLRAELERVKAELARSETRVTGLDGHVQCVADISEALRKLEPHRVSTGVKGLAERVVALLTPASDEVTEEQLRALDNEATDLADAELPGRSACSPSWQWCHLKHLIRLARRNHGGRRPKVHGDNIRGMTPEDCTALWTLCGRWAEQTDGDAKYAAWNEVIEFVDCFIPRKPFTLPLSEAQRKELAKAAHHAWYPSELFSSLDKDSQSDWFNVVDAIAPRIARMGVELPVGDAYRIAQQYLGISLRMAGSDGTVAITGTTDFARAILAAAQVNSGPPQNAELPPIAPPRGRKLTDGERERLEQLAIAWADMGDEYDQPQWTELIEFVESLLAPQDEVRVEIGLLSLNSEGYWVNGSGDEMLMSSTEEQVTTALSASPGDKFEFSVVARRVE